MLIRFFPSSRSIETVAGLPLILQLLLPLRLRLRCKSSVPSSASKPRPLSVACTVGLTSSNKALTKADFSPVRMISLEVRCPMMALMASIMILFPAPVSPVSTFSPPLKSMEVFSITAIFSI